MRRALLVAFVVALTAPLVPAAAAAAGGASSHPRLRATASITPPVQLFGDPVTAHVVVFANRRSVDPSRVHAIVDFSPYQPVARPQERVTVHGRLVELTWSWTLKCLSADCVPDAPPGGTARLFHLKPVRIHLLGDTDKVVYATSVGFPTVLTFSEISPKIVTFLKLHNNKIDWQYDLAPPAPKFRIAPGLVFWVALSLAILCMAAGLAIVGRWALRFRSHAYAVSSGQESSSLERALALFFWAGGRGDETLQRKALERVAAELPFDVGDLSDTTRALAWSPESPAPDEVEEISERAGVPTHHVHRAES